MKLFRCVNESCTHGEFEADAPACPACGAGELKVVELVPVHYLVPAEGPIKTAIGNRMVACNPKAQLPRAATGAREAVTCPRCKASAIYAEDERDGIDNHVPVLESRIAAGKG
jgi:hypothetical protein